MCFRPNGATASRRRRPPRLRQAPTLPPLAMLDLSKPGERQAHDFLCRATSRRDRMWNVFSLRRRGDVLFCVVRWIHPDKLTEPFALAEVGLTAIAVHWWYFASLEAARAELERRIAAPVTG